MNTKHGPAIIIYLFILLLSLVFPVSYSHAEEHSSMKKLLTMNLDELIDVEISLATKRPVSVRRAPAMATVITAAEIRDMGARNLNDVMKMVPGFGISVNEYGSNLYEVRGIRTMYSENILVMIDGHSLNRNFVGSALYEVAESLPVDTIKQIEVIRGPGSALYGANAFLGVINVITRNPEEMNGLEMKVSGGSFDYRKAGLSGGRIFDNGLTFAGSLDYSKTNGDQHTIEQDALGVNPVGKAFMGLERTDLYIKASFHDFSIKGRYSDFRESGALIGMGYALTDESFNPIVNYWTELDYNREVASDLLATIKLYYDYYQQESSMEVMPEGFAGSFPDGMIGEPWLRNRTHGAELQLDYDPGFANHFILGAVIERMTQFDVEHHTNFNPLTYAFLGPVQDVSANWNWNSAAKREIWALYVQDVWQIRDDLNLTGGMRYDHYSEFGGTTTPRIGLVWNFFKNVDLKLLYGQAFKAPSLNELYVKNNPVNLGNPDLQPAEIKTYEAGLGIRLAESFTIDLNYFNNQIENAIIWSSASPALHINAGKYEVEGVELVFTGRYSQDSYWKMTYTYQDPREADTDARLPYVPFQRAGLSMNYGINKYLSLHTDLLWTGKRPRDAGDPRPDMPSYTTVDLALLAKNFHKNFEISASIHNLFDKDYRDPDRSGAAQLIPNDFPREGMSAILAARYHF